MRRRGFTLVELLIVIVIGTIVTAMTVYTFYALNNNQGITKEASDVLSLIEKARTQTLASNNFLTYGLHFASSSIVLFQGTTYVYGTSTNQVYRVNGKTTLYSVALTGGATSFYFNKITGTPSATGTITVQLLGATTTTKIITIYATGLFQSN